MLRGRGSCMSGLAFSPSALLSADALASHILTETPVCTVLDCSWHLPSTKRDSLAEFMHTRIPGARRFDIDAPGFSDSSSALPHMLPSETEFGDAVRTLIPRSDGQVVVYSTNGFVGSARVWWMLRAFGFENCRVLDGGFNAWLEGGYPVESEPPVDTTEPPSDSPFIPKLNRDLVRSMAQALENIEAGYPEVYVDARSQERFHGTAPEPRPGLSSGHIPGSFCLPFTACVQAGPGPPLLRSREQLEALLISHGISVSPETSHAVTCGSGVTAPIIALALHELGFDRVPCYDGSWTEYADPAHQNPIQPGLP
jgi:thiosulfate/3-mercaptopyruvate sulfurtransferase